MESFWIGLDCHRMRECEKNTVFEGFDRETKENNGLRSCPKKPQTTCASIEIDVYWFSVNTFVEFRKKRIRIRSYLNSPYAVNCPRTNSPLSIAAILWVYQFWSAGRQCSGCMCYKGKLVFLSVLFPALCSNFCLEKKSSTLFKVWFGGNLGRELGEDTSPLPSSSWESRKCLMKIFILYVSHSQMAGCPPFFLFFLLLEGFPLIGMGLACLCHPTFLHPSLLHCKELETVATEVEKLVSSRPLTHVGGDEEQSECPLTPAMLIGNIWGECPYVSTDGKEKSASARFKVAQNGTLFPKMWWFFCSNHHLSYADNGQKKMMWGIWMKYCTRVGSKIGTQTKKSPKKHPCFSLQTAKSAMNWCFVAVFTYWYWVHL